MITNEVTIKVILESMTIEKCESCIDNVISKMREVVDTTEISMLPYIEFIDYYMDCMKVLREDRKIIEAKIDQITKDLYF